MKFTLVHSGKKFSLTQTIKKMFCVSRINLPYCVEYLSIYNSFITKPPLSVAIAQNLFVETLVASGVWDKLDCLYVFANNTQTNALKNWISPGIYDATLMFGAGGSVPVFQADWGFRGDVTNKSIIDSNFNPVTAGGKYTLNEASLGIFINDPEYVGTGTSRCAIGNGIRTLVSPTNSNNSDFRGYINSGWLALNGKTKSAFPVLYSIIRKNATTSVKYKNEVPFADEADNSGVLESVSIKFLSDGVNYYINQQASLGYIGGLLSTADLTVLSNAWQLYLNGLNLDTNAVRVSDIDDLYAHESQILMKSVGGVDYLFVIYRSDKTSHTEFRLNARIYCKVFDLATRVFIRTFECFYAGIVAGETLDVNQALGTSRGYFIGDYLRIYGCNASTLYVRNIDISNPDPALWVMSNISIAQMTMKDIVGADVLVNVTSANIQTHLEYTLGDVYAGYEDLMPQFRQLVPAVFGRNWYSTMDLSDEMSHHLGCIGIMINSTDEGYTWSFGSIIKYTVANRLSTIELCAARIGNELHIIARSMPTPNTSTNPIYHFVSYDFGLTFTQLANVPMNVVTAKPCMINAGNDDEVVIALNEYGEIIGSNYLYRTTLGIYSTSDFVNFKRINKTTSATWISYPSLKYFDHKLYVSYSKGAMAYWGRESIYFARVY